MFVLLFWVYFLWVLLNKMRKDDIRVISYFVLSLLFYIYNFLGVFSSFVVVVVFSWFVF